MTTAWWETSLPLPLVLSRSLGKGSCSRHALPVPAESIDFAAGTRASLDTIPMSSDAFSVPPDLSPVHLFAVLLRC